MVFPNMYHKFLYDTDKDDIFYNQEKYKPVNPIVVYSQQPVDPI